MGLVTDDEIEVLKFAVDAWGSGLGCCLVTLVETRGGAPRALGAQMAVREDSLYCGFVSGGCTEAAIAAEAREALKSGADRFFRLGDGSKFFDIVLPCGGGIEVSIHVLREVETLSALLANIERRVRSCLFYDPDEQALRTYPFSGQSSWEDGRFLRAYRPRPRIWLSGGIVETTVAARVATAVRYQVHHDGAPTPQTPAIDQDTAVVILHHDLEKEIPMLRSALDARPFYIGALGSKRTHERRSEALRELGYQETDIARIKAPIGIFGKTRDSHSLALSVLADIAKARETEP
ncbi:XdhC family protein [Ensifer adhaerens]|nr:XdhC family protein [Ensifer adhaerens]UAX97589.1 XdhC family protein [Ensifer adhaerens]UAY05020.1 XdhC family protein [Ensifer adhaerens]UAY12440.1 XdhC family protein [Ensifer adhaerens]